MGIWSNIRAFFGGEDAARAWDAAKTSRLNEAQWAYANGDKINDKLARDLVTLRNRAIDEAERNPFVEGMIETYVASVVGVDGPTLQVQSEDAEFNDWAERAWWSWWESPDINGTHSGVDTLRQWVRSLWTCGDFVSILTRVEGADGVALRLQDVHPRRLRNPTIGGARPEIIEGVERSETGKPIAYHIESFLASELSVLARSEFTRYPAESVIHGFKQREPGQVRGVPWLAPVLQTCADIRCYDEQVMDAARAAADMAVLLETNHPDAKYVAVNESTSVERRTMRTVPPGWSVKQLQAAQPAAQYGDYRSERLREIGRPVNMPLMMVRLDSSNHNYSSARFDGQLYSRGVSSDQNWIARIALNRLVKLVIREAALAEMYTVPEQVEYRWTWPRMPHVDPSKEQTASELGLANNTTTLADECAKDGKDWEQVLKQRSREYKMMESLGLTPVRLVDAAVLQPPASKEQPITPAQKRWIDERIEARLEERGVRS